MIPFRVFDREKKITWIVLNFQPGSAEHAGQYLVAREDDSQHDGTIKLLSLEEMCKLRLVDFYEDQD